MKTVILLVCVFILTIGVWAENIASPNLNKKNIKANISVSDAKITMTLPGFSKCEFYKEDNLWKINSISTWNESNDEWITNEKTLNGEFVFMGKEINEYTFFPYLYADNYNIIKDTDHSGIIFNGTDDILGAQMEWSASFFFNNKDNMPMLHSSLSYKFDMDIELGFSPKVVWRSVEESENIIGSMTHINNFSHTDVPTLIEKGYPIIWLNTGMDKNVFNTLLIDYVEQDKPDGRYFLYNKSAVSPYFSYWYIGSMAKNSSEDFAKYYWNFKHFMPGVDYLYPQQSNYKSGDINNLKYDRVYALNYSKLDFYRTLWSKALDYVNPVDSVDFWSKDWDGYAAGHIKEFKDDDENAGDRYVKGVGYYSAPKKDSMSHGGGNVVFGGTVSIINGILYYTYATDNKADHDFYLDRLNDVNVPKWASSSVGDKGWINEYWLEKEGYDVHWSSMWATLDMGAYNLYNIYKITGEKKYLDILKRNIDYYKEYLIKDRLSFGEHWNDSDMDWYSLTPESSFTKSVKLDKNTDPGDYPGAMSIYSYLSLLMYDETKDESYKENALKYIKHINEFVDKPNYFWTLCKNPKPNGFAFAAMTNIKLYEITKDKSYLDTAEEWVYLLLSFYHIRNENGGEIGFAHAGGLGVFDYVCVASLETIEPLYLAANLLKYRENKTLLRYISIADRRHLAAYPFGHTEKEFTYKYIPLELVPQRDSFAMYMAGPIMIENVMLHAIHSVSDKEITAICLNAARVGMDIKMNRNMLIYNPTGKKKDAVITFKYLAYGNYEVKIGNYKTLEMSSEELASKGIKFSLSSDSIIKILVNKK